ncbi:MAG: hypothetical protein R3F23_09485 [Verrucomicrobiia bacterium]
MNRPTSWLWEHLGPNNSWLPMMKLDGALTLYHSGGQATISLDPNGGSVFRILLTINGNNSVMPNQSLSGDGSIPD